MRYVIPITIVALVIPAFFIIGRRCFVDFGVVQMCLRVIVTLPLFVSAVGHFLRPALFAAIIPPAFPHHYVLVIVSGILEAAGAIGLLLPPSRRRPSVCLAILMVAIFPANVYIAGQTVGGVHMPGVGARTAMQAVFVTLILHAGWGIPGRKEAA